MQNNKIYLIVGEHTYYDEQATWFVAAHTDRAQAEKHVELIIAENSTNKYLGTGDNTNPYDPNPGWSLTDDVDYYIQEIHLVDSIPSFLNIHNITTF